jgi:glycosyltransferase involved in cell wall biosynthesis
MRILLISHDAYLHGATRSLIDIADFVRNEMIETYVFIPNEGIAEGLLRERKIPYEITSYPQLISYVKACKLSLQTTKLLSAIKHFPGFVRTVRKIKPDLVYVNTISNYWVLLLRLFVNAPLVFHIREFGKADHEMHFFFHGVLFRLFSKLPHLTLCNSGSVASFMNAHYQIRSEVVYNGVLPRQLFDENYEKRLVTKQSQPSSCVNIGIVGNITKGKGQLEAVRSFHRAMGRVPDIHLYIIGDGHRDSIENYVAQFGLEDKITITGFLKDVSDYYAKCDIVIVNSLMEAFGRVSVEAASFGLPVIARNTGANPEVIVDGETGLIHDGTEIDLSDKIEQLVVDRELRVALGKNAWRHAKNLFALEPHVEKMQGVFQGLLKRERVAEVLN